MTGTEIVVRSSLEEKINYAKHLAESGLLPAVYRRQPANVLYAAEYGEMLGLTPLAAINGLHIIEGKPTASAGMVSALVRRAGHRLRSSYDRETGLGWCEIVRHDDPGFTYRAEWTLQRAVDANLVQLKDGKPFARDSKGNPKPWERYPEAMLKARAITECARDACEEALNGVHYTPEELGADVDEVGEPIKVTAVREDQVPATPPQPTAPAQPAAAAEPVDWDAELAKIAGDYEAHRALWKKASELEPDNSALLLRIMEVGKALAPQPEEPVDAEIVEEDPPAEPPPAAAEPEPGTPVALLDKIKGQLDRLNVTPAERYIVLGKIIGRQIRSSKDVTTDEGALVADKLHLVLCAAEPSAALEELLKEPPATHPQLTAIAAALGEHGVKDRNQRLAVVGFLIGEPIASTAQLTRSEAHHVIDTIAEHTRTGHMAETIRAALAAAGETPSTPDTKEQRP